MCIADLRLAFAAVLLETNLSAHLYLLNDWYPEGYLLEDELPVWHFLIDISLHVRQEMSLQQHGEPPHFVTNELNYAKDTL
jgi:hypothetical protein